MIRIDVPTLSWSLIIAVAAITTGSEPARARDWQTITRNSEKSVIYIVATRSKRDGTDKEVLTSTGFLVRGEGEEDEASGYGITVAHAVPDPSVGEIVEYKASLGSRAGVQQDLIVISRDADLDIALFRLESAEGHRGLPVNTNPNLGRGSELGALGFSLGCGLNFVNGQLRNPVSSQGRWATTLTLNKGDSGGPVFDPDGNVVGVAVGALADANGLTYVIPGNLLTRVLSLVPKGGPASPSSSATYRVVGVAFGDVLHVRTSPNAGASVATDLRPDARGLTKMQCYGNGWCRIGLNNRELGYVNGKFLEPDSAQAIPPTTSSTEASDLCSSLRGNSQGVFSVIGVRWGDTLKIRASPQVTSDNAVGDIPPTATEVKVGACSGGWCVVSFEGMCGYASSQFLANGDTKLPPR